MAFVQAHADRTEPIEWLTGLVPGVTRLAGDADDPSACFAMHPSRSDLALPLVAPGRTEADVEGLRNWMNALNTDLAAGRPPEHDYTAPHPLLRQLLAWSAERAVDTDDAGTAQDGLADAARAARGTAADPIGELERLMRETARHARQPARRLVHRRSPPGAWRTSARRRPRGIQVGAYGWLDEREAAGAEAALAGLRARALARSRHDRGRSCAAAGRRSAATPRAPASPSTSPRTGMRRARWLVDGVRRGQDLGRAARRPPRTPPAGRRARRADRGPARRRARGRRERRGRPTPSSTACCSPAARLGARPTSATATARRAAAADELAALLASAERRPASARTSALRSTTARPTSTRWPTPRWRRASSRSPRATSRGDGDADRGRHRRGGLPARCGSPTRRGAALDDHAPAAAARRAGREPAPGRGPRTSGRALGGARARGLAGGRCSATPGASRSACRFLDPAPARPAAPPLARTLADVGLAALDLV